jgi:excisionase family DNA binding protein
MEREIERVPIWHKYALTVEEAAVYFHIGEGKLRRLLRNNPHASFVLRNGSRTQIKRAALEEYLNELTEV